MFGDSNQAQEKVIQMKQVVFGRSVQGASHIRSETECQDSYKRTICDDGTIILSVADGHGSKACPYSRTGSRIAVNVFCSILKNLYDGYAGNIEQLLTYLNREGDTRISKAIDDEWKKRVIEVHRKNKREIPILENGTDDLSGVYKKYGTTLLGLMITKSFVFAFQLGDGDICFTSSNGVDMVIEPEKILGVETHSLSRENAWEKAITIVRRINIEETLPAMFTLSTDGFANSYKNENEFRTTLNDYFAMINEHGAKTISDNLPIWLSETSSMGCGDDITLLFAYYYSSGESNAMSVADNTESKEDAIE